MKTRKYMDKIFKAGIITFSILTIAPLFIILITLLKWGINALNLDLITKIQRPMGERGGALNSIVGTLIITTIATIIASPISILAGVYVAEFPDKLISKITAVSSRLIAGIPSIVIGIVVYLWCVKPMGGYSALAGSIALAIMMIPNIVTATAESIMMIPKDYREASRSLGANFTRTTLKVIIPFALPGILTGLLSSFSRIAGETAPLLFTSFGNPFLNLNILKPMSALPLLIYNYATSPYREWHQIAWGASLILILIVFLVSIISRLGVKKWKA
jgi:phosphate transport system permease protein